jgi:RES domain-containing protein
MAPLPKDETLRKRITALKPIGIQGSFFRIVLEKYREEILSTAGSLQHGGRYNPKRESATLYLSENEQVVKLKCSVPSVILPFLRSQEFVVRSR